MTIAGKIGLGVAAALVVVVAIGGTAFWFTTKLIATNHWVSHTHLVLEHLQGLLSTLKDAETGQRGFLLTGKEPYLEPYRLASGEAGPIIARLRTMTRDNLEQLPRLDKLETAVEAKIKEM